MLIDIKKEPEQSILSKDEVLQFACKSSKKFGMFISFDRDASFEDIEKCVPYIDTFYHTQILLDGEGFLFFDTKDQMYKRFKETIGQDKDGIVYALTCDDQGILMSENT